MVDGDVELLQAACCIAGLDGEIHASERRILQVLARKVGAAAESLDAMIEQARADKAFYQRQIEVVRADPVKALNILTTLAIADGVLLAEERIVLRHMAQVMGLSDEHVDRVLASAEKAIEEGRAGSGGAAG